MRKIYLVRHGQCLDNQDRILNGHRDTDLTALGREQALAAGKLLKKKGITVIYASPLARTLHTAQIIAEQIGVGVIRLDKDLIERDFGSLTGKKVADISKYSKDTKVINGVKYFMSGEGVEDFPTLYKRAKKVLKRLVKKSPTENILIVTHGDLGMMIQAAYYGWDWERGLKHSFWQNGEVFELSEYSLAADKQCQYICKN